MKTSLRIGAFAERCRESGLDLVRVFGTSPWNAASAAPERLPSFGRENALALVVGNTRRLWPALKRAAREGRLDAKNPVDVHVEQAVVSAARELDRPVAVRFGHQPPYLPLQRIAQSAGLAKVGPARLSVHPLYGPWIGLRAVVLVDEDGPPVDSSAPDPCQGCAQPCLAAWSRLVEAGVLVDGATVAAHWKRWLEVRDSCLVGHGFRYSPQQAEYHYTHRRELLEED